MEQPKQINNTSERLVDDPEIEVVHPKSHIHRRRLFSIYAFEAMKAELEKVEEVRFIFTSPTFVADNDEEAATAKEICLASEIHAAKKKAGGTYLVICKM